MDMSKFQTFNCPNLGQLECDLNDECDLVIWYECDLVHFVIGHFDVCTQILHVQMYWEQRRVYQKKNHSSRVTAVWEWNIMIVTVDKFWLKSWGLVLFCSLAVLDPRVGWLHHGRTFSIYLCPLSFWLTVPRRVLSTSWCCPSRPCVVFLACVHLTLFLALSLSPGICFTQMTISTTVLL